MTLKKVTLCCAGFPHCNCAEFNKKLITTVVCGVLVVGLVSWVYTVWDANKDANRRWASIEAEMKKRDVTLATAAAVQAKIESLTRKKSGQGASLFEEYKKHYKTVNGKSFVKTCAGPSLCTNVLCDHKTFVKGKVTVNLPVVDDMTLDLFLVKCEREGYPVRRNFASAILVEKDNKIMPAFGQLKAEIDLREARLHMSGRVSVPYERIAAYRCIEMYKCRGDKNISKQTRDTLLEELELEESALASNQADSWKMIFGIKAADGMAAQAEGESYARVLHEGEKNYRAARAIAWMGINGHTKDEWEVESFMERWENLNCQPGALGRVCGGIGSNFRRAFWRDPKTGETLAQKYASDRDAVEGIKGVDEEDTVWEMQNRIPLFPLSHIIDAEDLAKKYYYPAEVQDTSVDKGKGKAVEVGEASGSTSPHLQATVEEDVGVEPAVPVEFLKLGTNFSAADIPPALNHIFETPSPTYHTEIDSEGRHFMVPSPLGDREYAHLSATRGNYWKIEDAPVNVDEAMIRKFTDAPIEVDEATIRRIESQIVAAKARHAAILEKESAAGIEDHHTEAQAPETVNLEGTSTPAIENHLTEVQAPKTGKKKRKSKQKRRVSDNETSEAESSRCQSDAQEEPVVEHPSAMRAFPDGGVVVKVKSQGYKDMSTQTGSMVSTRFTQTNVSASPSDQLTIFEDDSSQSGLEDSQSGIQGQGLVVDYRATSQITSGIKGQDRAAGSQATSQVASDIKGKGRAIDDEPSPQIASDVKGKGRAVEYDTTPQIALNDEPLEASKHEISHILEKFKNPAPYRDSEALLDETVDEEEDEEEPEEDISLPLMERDALSQSLDSVIIDTYKYKLGADAPEEKIKYVMSWGCSIYELANTLIILCNGSEAIATTVYIDFCLPQVKAAFAKVPREKEYNIPELVQMMYDAELLGWATRLLDTIQKYNKTLEAQTAGSGSSTQPPKKNGKRQNAKSKQLALARARKR